MVVAGLCGRIAFVQVARRLEVHQRDLGMQQRAVHPLALARALALQQGQQDADRRVDAGAAVGHGQARAQRPAAGMAGDRHQPAHALDDLVKAGPARIRAGLAEAGDAGQDDARVDGAQVLISQAQSRLDVRAPVLDHHVGGGDQAAQHGQAFRLLQVQRQRTLVAVQVLEVAAVAVGGEHGFVGIDAGGRFDADDVGAEVRQDAHAGRAGAHARQVEDAKARQGGEAVILDMVVPMGQRCRNVE